MNVVIFRNPGILDPLCIKTMGINVKEKENPIGFFGTGLKYAIAVLLRLGLEIEIWSCLDHYVFSIEKRNVRGKVFEFIKMNDEVLSFTTELGKNWTLWQVFRELYCNCLDEGGFAEVTNSRWGHVTSETTIVVKGELFVEEFYNKDKTFLNSKPLMTYEDCLEIHEVVSPTSTGYYRGIRAIEFDKRTLYAYNLLSSTELTEDRTIKSNWDFLYWLKVAILKSEDRKFIENCLTAPPDIYLEPNLDLSMNSHSPGPIFIEVAQRLLAEFKIPLHSAAGKLLQKHMESNICQYAIPKSLDSLDQLRLKRAVDFCEKLGYPISKYQVVVTETLGQGILGTAQDEKIFVSHRTLLMGTKMLAGTLIEEFIHLNLNLFDETRELQNYLIDTIVTLGERVTGEVL